MMLVAKLADLFIREGGAGADAAAAGPLGGFTQVIPMVLMFGVLYMLLFRPMSKQRKEHAELLSALKKDDEVVTSSGMWGRIINLDERVCTLEIADKVKIRILRDRIAGRWNPGNANSPVQEASAQK